LHAAANSPLSLPVKFTRFLVLQLHIQEVMMTHQAVHTCRQFRLLIVGSRNASDEMLQTAYQAVVRAKANGWLVLVGDNPRGVDAAVIDACDELGVNVIVFGVAARPRKGSQRPGSYWRVDTAGSQDDDEYVPAKAYIERDRYMIDLADRCFFIHDGFSRGTQAGYDYAMRQNKPADIRVFSVSPKPKPPITAPSTPMPAPVLKPAIPRPHTIELMVDVSACAESDQFAGVIGLRALDGQGHTLYDTQQHIKTEATTLDGAWMQALIAGLERLTTRLKSDTAPYRLRVYQTSKNVDGWVWHGWKRNAPEVQRLAGRIDTLLHAFPDSDWIKEPRPQLQSRLSKIGKGGEASSAQ
jgi:hypothetical protein